MLKWQAHHPTIHSTFVNILPTKQCGIEIMHNDRGNYVEKTGNKSGKKAI